MRVFAILLLSVVGAVAQTADDDLRKAWEICKPYMQVDLRQNVTFPPAWVKCEIVRLKVEPVLLADKAAREKVEQSFLEKIK